MDSHFIKGTIFITLFITLSTHQKKTQLNSIFHLNLILKDFPQNRWNRQSTLTLRYPRDIIIQRIFCSGRAHGEISHRPGQGVCAQGCN